MPPKKHTPKKRPITVVDFGFGLGEQVQKWKQKGRSKRTIVALEQEDILISGPHKEQLIRDVCAGDINRPSIDVLRKMKRGSVRIFNSNLTLFSSDGLQSSQNCRPIVEQIFRILTPNGRLYLTLEGENVMLARTELERAAFKIESTRRLKNADEGKTLIEKLAIARWSKGIYKIIAVKRKPK